MTKQNRLRMLYDWLRSPFIDEHAFDMGDWPHCALGEATRLPKLAADGIMLTRSGKVALSNGITGSAAGAAFFGLPKAAARSIFGCPYPRPPKKVAVELKPFLKGRS